MESEECQIQKMIHEYQSVELALVMRALAALKIEKKAYLKGLKLQIQDTGE